MKTAEQTAKELYPLRNIGGAAEFQQSAFISGVIFAQTWIPFEKQLPDRNVKLLVETIHHDVHTFTFTGTCDVKASAKFMSLINWRYIDLPLK